jgi:hypothetical protein
VSASGKTDPGSGKQVGNGASVRRRVSHRNYAAWMLPAFNCSAW